MAAEFSTGLSAGASAAMDALDRQQHGDGGNKIAGAAKDFEALLLGQILRSVHEDGGWLGTGDDDAGEAAIGLGEEQLARVMASSGGLGLSKLIETGLEGRDDAGDPSSTAPLSADPLHREFPLGPARRRAAPGQANTASQHNAAPI
jgi:Rod binding domain-containing protein